MHLKSIESPPYHRVFGLTGIMGSGKTTVAAMLEDKGAILVRADELARYATTPEYEGYDRVRNNLTEQLEPLSQQRYGESIFDGENLNRANTARLVFEDENALSILNTIIHREVGVQFREAVDQTPANKMIVYDVPLLYEIKIEKLVKKVIVVYVPEEIAIARALARTKLTRMQVEKRLKKQISIEKKKEMADYVIDNRENLEQLKAQMDPLWLWLLKWKTK
ncbi:MAG: dephospho-CoA kinase [Leptospirales bacterium]